MHRSVISYYEELVNSFNTDTSQLLIDIINFILENSLLCKQNSNKSFFHDLGFIKVVLLNCDDNSQVRFHIWQQNIAKKTPHTHPWNFKSKIIKGALTDVVYIEESQKDVGQAFNKYECISSFKKNGYVFKPKFKLNLLKSKMDTYLKDEIYEHNYRTIHLTENTDVGTITLCVTSRSLTDTSYVYTNKDSVQTNEGLKSLSNREYTNILNKLIVVLQNNH